MKRQNDQRPGFFKRVILGFTPFSLLIDEYLSRFNAEYSTRIEWLEERHLPESFSETFLPEGGLFSRDRRLVRCGFFVTGEIEHSHNDDLFIAALTSHPEIVSRSSVYRMIRPPVDLVLHNPGVRILLVCLWIAESLPLEKIFAGKRISDSATLLDGVERQVMTLLLQRPWRRWREVRYRIYGSHDHAGLLLKHKSRRLSMILSYDPGSDDDTVLPGFFERIHSRKHMIKEHEALLHFSNFESLQSLTFEMERNGEFRFLSQGILAAHYNRAEGRWHRLDTDRAPERRVISGVLRRDDRLLFCAGPSSDGADRMTGGDFSWLFDLLATDFEYDAPGRTIILKRDG